MKTAQLLHMCRAPRSLPSMLYGWQLSLYKLLHCFLLFFQRIPQAPPYVWLWLSAISFHQLLDEICLMTFMLGFCLQV